MTSRRSVIRDIKRQEREDEALGEFRDFLGAYRLAITFSTLQSPEFASLHLEEARTCGQDLLARLLKRQPTRAEIESLIKF